VATIGFVGLGVMGGNIARRLLDAGHAVQGYNRTAAKAESLVEVGMTLAATPRAAATGAGVVFSMVSDGDALTAVCAGPDGILAGLGEGSIYVDLSTVGPVASEATRIAAEEHGARFLAAPVSGSVSTIREGRLSFMVGGSEEALAEVRPLLLDIGPEIRHVGSVQQAAAMKMAVNLSVAIQVIAFSEGVLLAERYGVDPGRAVDVLLHSVVASPMLAYRGRFLLDPPEVPWFTVALARKDVRIMQDMAERMDLPLWSAATAAPILAAAQALGYGQDELASVGHALRAMSDVGSCDSGSAHSGSAHSGSSYGRSSDGGGTTCTSG
jgi:3-hydroxyisobutyrate dehydrogenase-like beta-hydroxyacid dehydrogenase